MFKITSILSALALACIEASHLDNVNGVFDNFSFDQVKFKTRTNCSLDKYPEVSHSTTILVLHTHTYQPTDFDTNVVVLL